MLALLNEGRTDPSLTDVAARVGIPADAVLPHFDSVEDLRRELIVLHITRVEALLAAADLRDGSMPDRAARFVEARLEFCSTMAGTGRVGHARAQVPEIADAVQRVRDLWHAHTCRQFEPELSRLAPPQAEQVVDAIDGLFDFNAWDELVSVQGRSVEQIRRAWTRTLLAQLTTGPEDIP
jgi:AcrR family transcriptional regulator